jgi:smad nuclear-interacting protein 1
MPPGEGSRWSRRRSSASAEKEENPNKTKANFSLSSALAADVQTGYSRQGVTLKFSEHLEARVPNTRWRLYVFRKKDASSSAAAATTDSSTKPSDIVHVGEGT